MNPTFCQRKNTQTWISQGSHGLLTICYCSLFPVRWGICAPKQCSEEDVTKGLRDVFKGVYTANRNMLFPGREICKGKTVSKVLNTVLGTGLSLPREFFFYHGDHCRLVNKIIIFFGWFAFFEHNFSYKWCWKNSSVKSCGWCYKNTFINVHKFFSLSTQNFENDHHLWKFPSLITLTFNLFRRIF